MILWRDFPAWIPQTYAVGVDWNRMKDFEDSEASRAQYVSPHLHSLARHNADAALAHVHVPVCNARGTDLILILYIDTVLGHQLASCDSPALRQSTDINNSDYALTGDEARLRVETW